MTIDTVSADLTNRIPTLTTYLSGSRISPERFVRVVLQAIAKNPDLLKCDRNSLILAVMEAAQLGLEPTGVLGNAYLVPFWNAKASRFEATLITGYRGLISLVRRSGEVDMIEARLRYKGDVFHIEYGSDPRIDHVPELLADKRGPVIGAYMIARVRGSDVPYIEYMTDAELDAIRKRSRASQHGPWVTDPGEMQRKTVVRRGIKYLPISVFVEHAIEIEDAAEEVAGLPPGADEQPPTSDPLLERLEAAAVASSDGPPDTEDAEAVSADGMLADGLPPLP
jgi:recombination protein RecT